MVHMYYFGCWRIIGHHIYLPDGSSAWRLLIDGGLPWSNKDLDTGLCPPGPKTTDGQIQGNARLHHKNGWTAMAFWDRSIDNRVDSNSVFIIQQTLDFKKMLDTSRLVFPQIWERFRFQVVQFGPVVEW